MNIFEIAKKSSFFSALDDEEIKYIVQSSSVKEIKKNTIIHTIDEVCKNITVIFEGKVYSSSYSLAGKEQIVCNFEKSMVFGFPAVFGDMTYPENIIAENNCKLLYISRDKIA